MKVKIILSLFLLIVSCSKYSEVSKDSVGNFIVKQNDMSLSSAQVIPWLGLKNHQVPVSRGLKLTVSLPQLKDSDLAEMAQSKGADHWLIRVRRNRSSSKEDLGAVSIPLFHRPVNFKKPLGKPRQVEIDIVYMAAYARARFTAKVCPLGGHNLQIAKLQKESMTPLTQTFSVSKLSQVSYHKKVEPISFTSHKLNGGYQLLGDYFVDLAFYDGAKKKVLSNFVTYPYKISVEQEKASKLSDCIPMDSADPESSSDLIKEFKFGR